MDIDIYLFIRTSSRKASGLSKVSENDPCTIWHCPKTCLRDSSDASGEKPQPQPHSCHWDEFMVSPLLGFPLPIKTSIGISQPAMCDYWRVYPTTSHSTRSFLLVTSPSLFVQSPYITHIPPKRKIIQYILIYSNIF